MKTAWVGFIEDSEWTKDIMDLLESVTNAKNALLFLEQNLRENDASLNKKGNYKGLTASNLLEQIKENLQIIDEKGENLYARFSSTPHSKLMQTYFHGQRLSREQYYVLAAAGATLITPKSMGVIDQNEFEFFDMFCYEDDHRCCFINPDPSDTGERMGIGRFPEELDINGLRPEQNDFFKTNFPDIYSRFKRESAGE